MMCCSQCPFNPRASLKNDFSCEYFAMSEVAPICIAPLCPRSEDSEAVDHPGHGGCPDCPHRREARVCAHDHYVLRHICGSDPLANETAHHTLDTLVAAGKGDLLCELFRSANPDARRSLWRRMVSLHHAEFSLLDALFERHETVAPEAEASMAILADLRNRVVYHELQPTSARTAMGA